MAGNGKRESQRQRSERNWFQSIGGSYVEADDDEKSPVQWNFLDNTEKLKLPDGLSSLNKYVKGPKKLERFLSQVAIVKNNKEGEKYQKQLKNGQIAVSKETPTAATKP